MSDNKPTELMLKIEKAKNFNELGQAHVDLILDRRGQSPAKMARQQAFYNASVITRMLELLCDEREK